MIRSGNSVVQVLLVLAITFLAIVFPVVVVVSLFLSGAHLGLVGYLIVGASLFFLLLVPGVASALLSSWLVDRRTPEGRRPFAVLVSVVGVFHIACIAAVIVATAQAGASPLIPVVIAVCTTLYTFGLLRLGEKLGLEVGKREAALPIDLVLAPVKQVSFRATAWVMGAVFVVVAAIGVALALLATSNARPSHRSSFILDSLFLAFAFAFVAASVVAISRSLPLAFRIRPLFRGSYRTQKAVTRAVFRGRNDGLDPVDRAVAFQFALMMKAMLPFNAAQFFTALAGIALMQLGALVSPGDDSLAELHVATVVIVVGSAAFGLAYLTWSMRRVRRYLHETPVPAEILP